MRNAEWDLVVLTNINREIHIHLCPLTEFLQVGKHSPPEISPPQHDRSGPVLGEMTSGSVLAQTVQSQDTQGVALLWSLSLQC